MFAGARPGSHRICWALYATTPTEGATATIVGGLPNRIWAIETVAERTVREPVARNERVHAEHRVELPGAVTKALTITQTSTKAVTESSPATAAQCRKPTEA